MLYLDCIGCFFFFKQKTAYEMRISDWSSDVCSSDLDAAREDRGMMAFQPRRHIDELGEGLGMAFGKAVTAETLDLFETSRREVGLKIGRASCRERVCQYV